MGQLTVTLAFFGFTSRPLESGTVDVAGPSHCASLLPCRLRSSFGDGESASWSLPSPLCSLVSNTERFHERRPFLNWFISMSSGTKFQTLLKTALGILREEIEFWHPAVLWVLGWGPISSNRSASSTDGGIQEASSQIVDDDERGWLLRSCWRRLTTRASRVHKSLCGGDRLSCFFVNHALAQYEQVVVHHTPRRSSHRVQSTRTPLQLCEQSL